MLLCIHTYFHAISEVMQNFNFLQKINVRYNILEIKETVAEYLLQLLPIIEVGKVVLKNLQWWADIETKVLIFIHCNLNDQLAMLFEVSWHCGHKFEWRKK